MLGKTYRFIGIFCILGLVACTPKVAPVEQMQTQMEQPQTIQVKPSVSSKAQKQVRHLYRCAENKTVRIQQVRKVKNLTVKAPTSGWIVVTFGEISHKLSPTVTKSGKKYSNIRWQWTEKNGKGTLQDNSHNVLAKECVKQ